MPVSPGRAHLLLMLILLLLLMLLILLSLHLGSPYNLLGMMKSVYVTQESVRPILLPEPVCVDCSQLALDIGVLCRIYARVLRIHLRFVLIQLIREA